MPTTDEWGNVIVAGIGAYDAFKQGDKDQVQSPYFVPGQEEGLARGIDAAGDLLDRGPREYYGEPTVAGLDPNIIAGQNARLGATDRLNQMGDMSGTAAGTLAGGGASRVGGFQLQDQVGFGIPKEYQDAIMNPIMGQLDNRISGIHTGATEQGAFGGSRMQQQKADATSSAMNSATEAMIRGNLEARRQSIGQRAGDTTARLQGRSQDINQNQIYNNAMNQGVNALGTAMNQTLLPGQNMIDMGNQRSLYEQELIKADKARFDFTQAENENYLDRFLNRMNNTPAGGTVARGNGGSFGDAMAGAGQASLIYNSIFNPSSTSSGSK